MSSTYSDQKIQLMAAGENTTAWGNVTNVNLGTAIEEMVTKTGTVTFASADETLTLANTNATQTARRIRLKLNGVTGGVARNLTIPAISKVIVVSNECADAITVKASGGTGISVPAGKTMWLVNDGTNVVDAVTHLSSLSTAGAIAAGGNVSGTNISGTNISGTNATFSAALSAASASLTTPLPVASGGTGVNSAVAALAAFLPIGVIFDYGGTAAPSGFLMAYGQNVSRTTYSALFAVYSTTYGSGDGSTTFGLPDLRGRVVAGKDNMGGSDAGRLSGFNGTTLGGVGGEQSVTLTTATMPAHTHGITDPGHTHSFTGSSHNHSISDPTHTHSASLTAPYLANDGSGTPLTPAGVGTPVNYSGDTTVSVGYAATGISVVAATAGGAVGSNTTGITTGSNGSGSAHDNVQPTFIMNKIIFAGV